MKIKSNLIVALILAVMLFCAPAFAETVSAITETFNTTSVYKVNEATPGLREVSLGTRLQGPLATGSQTDTEGTYATDNDTTGETITETHVHITTGANWGSSTTLADGYTNQEITFTLVTDGGQDHKLSPSTKTGFTDLAVNDAGDSVKLKFINSTIGWTVSGGEGYNIDDDYGSHAIAPNTYTADNDTGGETITEAVAIIETGSAHGSSTTLNDGYINQELTFVLETDGGQDHTLSPSTKTGFSSITLDTANESVTLKYISDTIGWIVDGNVGSTIN